MVRSVKTKSKTMSTREVEKDGCHPDKATKDETKGKKKGIF